MANFPVYNAVINTDDEGISVISFVTSPATEINALYFSKEESLVFAEEDKQMITSVVMLADTPIYRRSGDYEYYVKYDKDTLLQMSQKMLKDGTFNTVSFEHDGNIIPAGNIELVELYTKDKTKQSPFTDVPDGSIIATYKVINSELWAELKAHPLSISLEGTFDLVEDMHKYTKQNNMSKIIKTLMSMLKFAEIATDKGQVYYTGEDLAVGLEVFDEGGNPLADGEYVIDEQHKFTVKDGVVTEVVAPEEPEPEEPKEDPEEKQDKDDEKDAKIAELEALIEEKDAKIAELEAKIAELEGAATDKEAEFSAVNAENAELKAKIEEYEKQTPKSVKDRFAAYSDKKLNKISSIAETIKTIKK